MVALPTNPRTHVGNCFQVKDKTTAEVEAEGQEGRPCRRCAPPGSGSGCAVVGLLR